MSKIVIVGGSGKIAKLFSRLATSKTGAQITSLVRSRDHFDAISETGATPQLLDIESAKVEELQQAFEGAQGVLFAAGAGGKGPKERTRKVDEEGAIKASLEPSGRSPHRLAARKRRAELDHRQPETPAVQDQPCARDYPDPARTLLYRSLTLSSDFRRLRSLTSFSSARSIPATPRKRRRLTMYVGWRSLKILRRGSAEQPPRSTHTDYSL